MPKPGRLFEWRWNGVVMGHLWSDIKMKEVSAQSALAKGMIVVIPASLLPDWFPHHPHIAFSTALLTGFLLQNFIKPRWWGFLPFLLLSLVLVVLNIVFIK
jgi:hypothetical protein